MQFLIDNPMLLLAIALAAMAVCAYFIVKPRKRNNVVKSESSDLKEPIAKSDSPEESEKNDESEKSENDGESKDENNERNKKRLKRTKPEITHVYEKKKIQTKIHEEQKEEGISKAEEELLKRMQFVSSSGKVSRLKAYTQPEELVEQDVIESVAVLKEEAIEEKKKTSHFDRTRRLSNMIKEGSLDDMFCSHISEKYMNMDDIERHLKTCNEVHEKLFERAAETMANSEAKVSISDDGKVKELSDKTSMKTWLEERRRQELAKFMVQDSQAQESVSDEEIVDDGFDLSARTVLVVDSILKRKGKKPRKS